MNLSGVPYKFQYRWAQNATGSFVTTPIPATTSAPAASQSLGFPPETAEPIAAGGTPPNINDYNGAYQYATAWLQWLQSGGPVQYDATHQTNIGGYPNGALIQSGTSPGKFWLSTIDANTSNPDTGGSHWMTWPNGGVQVLSSSGTFTVPPNVYFLKRVRLWGSGAGGGTSNSSFAGSGGGAGGYVESINVPVTPGAVLTYTQGAPGAGGGGTSGGGSSSASSFNGMSTLGATGGTGAGSASSQVGGAGGIASGGTLNMNGQSGDAGNPTATQVGGRGGSSPAGGQGGNASTGVAGVGLFPGGGGAGGGSGLSSNGGDGAPGCLIVEW